MLTQRWKWVSVELQLAPLSPFLLSHFAHCPLKMGKNGIVQFITALFSLSLSLLALFRFVPQHLLSICLTPATMTASRERSSVLVFLLASVQQLLYCRLVPLSTRNLTLSFFFFFLCYSAMSCTVSLSVCLPNSFSRNDAITSRVCLVKRRTVQRPGEKEEHEIEKK